MAREFVVELGTNGYPKSKEKGVNDAFTSVNTMSSMAEPPGLTVADAD